jgi:hypothetical protein
MKLAVADSVTVVYMLPGACNIAAVGLGEQQAVVLTLHRQPCLTCYAE